MIFTIMRVQRISYIRPVNPEIKKHKSIRENSLEELLVNSFLGLYAVVFM